MHIKEFGTKLQGKINVIVSQQIFGIYFITLSFKNIFSSIKNHHIRYNLFCLIAYVVIILSDLKISRASLIIMVIR